MRKAKSGHIVITGTGRSGTTLLVQLFTALGFDTGYTLEQAARQVDSRSKSGLESWLTKGNPPHVVKSPWIVDEIDQLVKSGEPKVEHFIIPVRDLFASAESRRQIYNHAKAQGADPMSWPGTIWKTPNPAEQEAALAKVFYGLVQSLVEHAMPHTLLAFPRFAEDVDYLYERLSGLFTSYGVSKDEVRAAMAKVYRPEFIHKFKPENPAENVAADPVPFIADILGPEWVAREPWLHRDLQLRTVNSPFYECWKSIPGGHKKYAYFSIYDTMFAALRGQKLNVLEIGVYQGASLTAWRKYLGAKANIVGIDIDERCRVHDRPAEGIHVRIGHQAEPAFLKRVVDEFGLFDVIMDDGSHMTSHQIQSFDYLFRSGLKAGGIYFLEDINTSFWPAYRDGKYDVFDLLHACSLGMNHVYMNYSYKDYVSTAHPGSLDAIAINKMIREVRVFDSACAIYKADETFYPPMVIHN